MSDGRPYYTYRNKHTGQYAGNNGTFPDPDYLWRTPGTPARKRCVKHLNFNDYEVVEIRLEASNPVPVIDCLTTDERNHFFEKFDTQDIVKLRRQSER